MKRFILFFALATLLASCTPDTYETYETNNTYVNASVVVNLKARAQDWTPLTDLQGNIPLYYTCSFDMPEITSDVFAKGSVQTYIYNNNAQQALPYVIHYKNTLGETWTRTIDCEYGVGFIHIFYTNSDFSVTDAPAAMDFRVVVSK